MVYGLCFAAEATAHRHSSTGVNQVKLNQCRLYIADYYFIHLDIRNTIGRDSARTRDSQYSHTVRLFVVLSQQAARMCEGHEFVDTI